MHVRTGDEVIVIAGKEKGKRGKILKVLRKANRVVVERVNLTKRHQRPTQQRPEGGIIEKEASLAASNVMLWCGKCEKGSRTRSEEADGKKRRVCIKCASQLETA